MNIYEAIADIMKEGCAIGKSKFNPQQKFNYRGIDDVMNTFQPLLSQRGIFLVPEVLEHHREERTTKNGGNLIYSVLKVKYTFFATDGSSVSAVVIGEGMDSADKSSNKAMAAAMKYAMFQVFCIPTEEMKDPDADSPPPTTSVPPPAPDAPPPVPGGYDKDAVMFKCESCGDRIMSYINHKGEAVGARKHCEGSKEKFDQVLCLKCIEKRNAGGNTNA